MSLNIEKLRQELSASVNIYAVARDEYGLEVSESIETPEEVVSMCVAVEYENQFK